MSKEALKLAIEALEKASEYRELKHYEVEALYACKEALEQPAQPVAWINKKELEFITDVTNNTVLITTTVWHKEHYEDDIPLYTHPAQPLSDDEILEILDNSVYCEIDAIPFARAIEKAHGIGAN